MIFYFKKIIFFILCLFLICCSAYNKIPNENLLLIDTHYKYKIIDKKIFYSNWHEYDSLPTSYRSKIDSVCLSILLPIFNDTTIIGPWLCHDSVSILKCLRNEAEISSYYIGNYTAIIIIEASFKGCKWTVEKYNFWLFVYPDKIILINSLKINDGTLKCLVKSVFDAERKGQKEIFKMLDYRIDPPPRRKI